MYSIKTDHNNINLLCAPRAIRERQFTRLVQNSLELQKRAPRHFPSAKCAKWSRFIVQLQQKQKAIPKPFSPVAKLVQLYLPSYSQYPVLDIGCETGKNAACLIRGGHQVTLLDITHVAIQCTVQNLKKVGLEGGIAHTVIGGIEDLGPTQGPFKAIVGTYAFSFISPKSFQEVMQNNVLRKIEVGGYFAGGFFGPSHAWAKNPHLTIMTAKKIASFFREKNFVICDLQEKIKVSRTVRAGNQTFHTIEVIAKRISYSRFNLE